MYCKIVMIGEGGEGRRVVRGDIWVAETKVRLPTSGLNNI